MTPTFAPAEAGLLRAIVEDPADDVARLVYADWLEEHGQEERAEFIRVQLEIATLLRGKHPWVPGAPLPARADRKRLVALGTRERELLEAHRLTWLPRPCMNLESEHAEPVFYYRRGFVALVHCTLEDWYGEVCTNPHCREGKEHRGAFGWQLCYECYGTGWRKKGHGPAIVAASPIEVVRLMDRKPLSWTITDTQRQEWYWRKAVRAGEGKTFLEAAIWELLGAPAEVVFLHNVKRYRTEQAALDALSAALLT